MGLFSNNKPKFNIMDTVDKILNETRIYEQNSFEENLKVVYTSNYWFKGVEAYTAYIYLMMNNYFFDPHICKELRQCMWKMSNAEKYNNRNVERRLIDGLKREFSEYDYEKLKTIYMSYLLQEPSVYVYKDSKYYFTYAKTEDKLSNHYAYFASAELLNEKYNVNIEPVDLSENNYDDFRKIRSEERIKMVETLALKATLTVVKKHVPEDWLEESD